MTAKPHGTRGHKKGRTRKSLQNRTLMFMAAASLCAAVTPVAALAEEGQQAMGPDQEVMAILDVQVEEELSQPDVAPQVQANDEQQSVLNADANQQPVLDAGTDATADGAIVDSETTTDAAAVPEEQDATKAPAAQGADLTNPTPEAQQDIEPAAAEDGAQLGEAAASKWETGHWDVRELNGSYYRFWVSADGEAYKGGLVLPEWGTGTEKAGYYAWANSEGIIVRGTYTDGTYVWLADNDGRLMDLGWNVSSDYSHGLQRYYIVDEGRHAAKIGLDEGAGEGNWAHYTVGEGYVLRGKRTVDANSTYVADNEGRLPTTRGWLVTGDYDGGQLQRYYIDGYAARTGTYEVNGSRYLGVEGEGYVLRGYDSKNLAFGDNDGRLVYNSWLVTDNFGQGLQRYWMGMKGLALRDTLIDASIAGWNAYARPEGYVVRGKYVAGENIYFANGDGMLEADGWLVTEAYGDGLQRYYIEPSTHSARVGYSASGYDHYTLPAGYVLRGAHQEGDWMYLANGDGLLPQHGVGGWMASDQYGSGLQRYYLERTPEGFWGTRVGYSEVGYPHYTLEGVGCVLRNGEIFVAEKGWLTADNEGRLTQNALPGGVQSEIVERYLSWAIAMANDNSHGYSQIDRWGPDYDCSSLVISALNAAGLETGEATYTGNMRSELSKYGWAYSAYNGNPASLLRGDILLHDQNHVEFYLGNLSRLGAHSDENGGIGEGARSGDQTGNEISIKTGDVGTWFTWVLRLKA